MAPQRPQALPPPLQPTGERERDDDTGTQRKERAGEIERSRERGSERVRIENNHSMRSPLSPSKQRLDLQPLLRHGTEHCFLCCLYCSIRRRRSSRRYPGSLQHTSAPLPASSSWQSRDQTVSPLITLPQCRKLKLLFMRTSAQFRRIGFWPLSKL